MTQQKLHPFNIDEMIAREDDPKARAYLIILSSVHHAMLANTSATLEVKRSLDEHLTNFEKQTEEHRALMNQGRGAARVVAWVLGVVQIIGLAIWVEARADLKGIHDALTAAQAVDIRANAKLDEHETRLKPDPETLNRKTAGEYEQAFRTYCAQARIEQGRVRHPAGAVAYGGL